MTEAKKLGQLSVVATKFKFTTSAKVNQPLWTTSELAEKVGLSPKTLGVLIRERGGIEPLSVGKSSRSKKYGLHDFRKWWAIYRSERP